MLKLLLKGNCCNNWPTVTILHNSTIVFDNEVVNETVIELPISLANGDCITISGIGKRHGEDGIWDTQVDSEGNIINDKYLKINNILINDIPMGTEWIKTINNGIDSIYNNTSISFTVHGDLLDWIITEKFIKQEQGLLSKGSFSGLDRYAYSNISAKIDSIKSILND